MTAQFPTLPGLAWSTFKTPQFKSHIQKGVSGRELRLIYQTLPTWLFKLKFDFLRDKFDQRQGGGWGTTLSELRTLMGFFLEQQGSFTPFLFDDPTDDNVEAQPIGTGDGTTTAFQLVRTMPTPGPGFNEPIIAPNSGQPVNIYFNGTLQSPSLYTVNYGNGIVTFGSAPTSGVAITADFYYFFFVRFAEDTLDFENFLYQLWSVGELKLQSVLL